MAAVHLGEMEKMEPDLLDALEQANAQDVSEVLVNPGRRCRKFQGLSRPCSDAPSA